MSETTTPFPSNAHTPHNRGMTDTPTHKPGAVDAGVFVAALILMFVSVAHDWTVLAWLSGAVMVGVMVTTVARRQQHPQDKVPRGADRPWKQ